MRLHMSEKSAPFWFMKLFNESFLIKQPNFNTLFQEQFAKYAISQWLNFTVSVFLFTVSVNLQFHMRTFHFQ